jgi:hypothetical protein
VKPLSEPGDLLPIEPIAPTPLPMALQREDAHSQVLSEGSTQRGDGDPRLLGPGLSGFREFTLAVSHYSA